MDNQKVSDEVRRNALAILSVAEELAEDKRIDLRFKELVELVSAAAVVTAIGALHDAK